MTIKKLSAAQVKVIGLINAGYKLSMHKAISRGNKDYVRLESASGKLIDEINIAFSTFYALSQSNIIKRLPKTEGHHFSVCYYELTEQGLSLLKPV